jgi:hypothetical protein
MTVTPCQLLDDYIGHDLIGDERERFEAHLPACLACQQVIREAKGLESLLSSAVVRLEPVPHDLISRTELRLRSVRRRFAAGLAALAASVVIVVLVSRPLFLPEIEVPAPSKHELPQPRLADVDSPKVEVRVRFPRAARVIAVPVASDSPHVTLVRVYSGLRDGPSAGEMKKGGSQFNQGAKYEHN